MFCRRPQRTLQQSAVKLLCARIHKSVGGGVRNVSVGQSLLLLLLLTEAQTHRHFLTVTLLAFLPSEVGRLRSLTVEEYPVRTQRRTAV